MRLLATPEFRHWRAGLDEHLQALIESRLQRVRHDDHFGDHHDLGSGRWEMRWANGMRLYYAVVRRPDGTAAVLLLGGDKRGQDRDVQKARRLLRRELS